MRTLGMVVLASLITVPLAAQGGIIGPGYAWIAEPCADHRCAIEALVTADGDVNVVAIPTRAKAHPWVILRRIDAGSVSLPADRIFDVEPFDGVAQASARFSSIDDVRAPMIVSTNGGSLLVVSLHHVPAKQRAVRR